MNQQLCLKMIKIFAVLAILIVAVTAQQMQMSSQSGPWGGNSMASGYGVPGGFQAMSWPGYGYGGYPNYGNPGFGQGQMQGQSMGSGFFG